MDQTYEIMYPQTTVMVNPWTQLFSTENTLFWILFSLYMLLVYWRIFTKAGQAGWKALIPIYNAYILLKIVNRSGWWILLYLIPFINIIIAIVVLIDLGKAFGKKTLWSILLLVLLPFIGMSILAFSGSKYKKPKH